MKSFFVTSSNSPEDLCRELLDDTDSAECPMGCFPPDHRFTSQNEAFKHVLTVHCVHALHVVRNGERGFAMPCWKSCIERVGDGGRRAHYHCPGDFCDSVLGRKQRLAKHLDRNKCGCTVLLEEARLKSQQGKTKIKCMHCPKEMSSLKSLRRHGKRHGKVDENKLPSICIDRKNGFFMVAATKNGLMAPLHVRKHILNQIPACSDEDCQTIFENTCNTQPGIQCQHIDSVTFSHHAETKCLDESFLEELVVKNVISGATRSKCIQMKEKCMSEGFHLVVYADFEALGFNKRHRYYSVYTGEEHYYCRLQRLRVTFDTELGHWSCQCPVSGQNRSCAHEAMAKWYVLQHQSELMKNYTSFQVNNSEDEFLMKYFLLNKEIPEDVPNSLLGFKPKAILEPNEKLCPRCHQELQLSSPNKCTIYGCGTIWKDILICKKKCYSCNLTVPFQDYQSGAHNFDGKLLLTLDLCLYLRKGLQCHVPFEGMLKLQFQKNVPVSRLRNGFFHYLALTKFSYDFNCLKCGFDPRIVFADGNWKNACRQEVESVKQSGLGIDVLNIDETWKNNRKELIGRGFNDLSELDWFCLRCNGRLPPNDNTDWVQCDACDRWCHFWCTGLKNLDDCEFLCNHCTEVE